MTKVRKWTEYFVKAETENWNASSENISYHMCKGGYHTVIGKGLTPIRNLKAYNLYRYIFDVVHKS